MRKLLLIFSLIFTALAAFPEEVYTPEMMPNVNVKNRYEFVSDPAGMLSADVKSAVNKRLYDLRQNTTCEVVVAIPPSIGDETIEEWSEELFSLWGIGKKDKDNGLLIVISPGSRKARIEVGYGLEGVLTDIACNNIIGHAVIPNMKNDDLARAVDESTASVEAALTDPAVAEELRSSQPDNYSGAVHTLSADVIWKFVCWVAFFMFAAALCLFIADVAGSRKRDNYKRAVLWRSHLVTYGVLGVLSMGAALPFLLIAWWIYRSSRNRRRRCPTCGARMNKLSEEADNELLSDSQDFEEKLNTVDYDVWECPKCGTVERFPFKVKQTKYTECPRCHTVAMCLDHEVITKQPTVRSEGQGVKVYECQFCHYRDDRPFKIPKKEDPTAIAAGAVLGALSSRGGGGGFGGGFGGGMSGGGGASGGW